MTNPFDDQKFVKMWEDWLAIRPECVQKLAREFPARKKITVNGLEYFIIGYTEEDRLIISQINPGDHYEEALEKKEYICAKHLRENQ